MIRTLAFRVIRKVFIISTSYPLLWFCQDPSSSSKQCFKCVTYASTFSHDEITLDETRRCEVDLWREKNSSRGAQYHSEALHEHKKKMRCDLHKDFILFFIEKQTQTSGCEISPSASPCFSDIFLRPGSGQTIISSCIARPSWARPGCREAECDCCEYCRASVCQWCIVCSMRQRLGGRLLS